MGDVTIRYTEEMVGSGHPTKADTLNRLALVEHDATGSHTKSIPAIKIAGGTIDGVTIGATSAPVASIRVPVIDASASVSAVVMTAAQGCGGLVVCRSTYDPLPITLPAGADGMNVRVLALRPSVVQIKTGATVTEGFFMNGTVYSGHNFLRNATNVAQNEELTEIRLTYFGAASVWIGQSGLSVAAAHPWACSS